MREPAVAGQFYPRDAVELRHQLAEMRRPEILEREDEVLEGARGAKGGGGGGV